MELPLPLDGEEIRFVIRGWLSNEVNVGAIGLGLGQIYKTRIYRRHEIDPLQCTYLINIIYIYEEDPHESEREDVSIIFSERSGL